MSVAGSNVLPLVAALDDANGSGASIERVSFICVLDDGRLRVQRKAGGTLSCLLLDTGSAPPRFEPADELLALVGAKLEDAVVLGKVVRLGTQRVPSHLVIEAKDSLTLKVGDASVGLRADGKVLIRGEDVLVRAKGTKRIRAGTVSIN